MIKRIIGDILRKLKRIFSQIVDDVVYDEYVRRAFANNAFDGALTILGILMGNLVVILGPLDCFLVAVAGIAVTVLLVWSTTEMVSVNRMSSTREEK